MRTFELDEIATFHGEEKDYVSVQVDETDGSYSWVQIKKNDVIALRNWLNEWLDKNVFDLKPES